MAFSRERGNQLWQLHKVEDAPEIVDERGQAELAANLLQPSYQKRTLVHPLLDRAERVFDGLASRDGTRSGIDCPCIASGSRSLGRLGCCGN